MAAIDPVCHMTVEEAEAAATYTYKGETYYFCAPMCRDRFAKEQERFLNGRQEAEPSQQSPETKGIMDGETVIRIDLPIRGMSCASCVDKIETRLRSLPGVTEASVNFATEKASVKFVPTIHSPTDLANAIREIGYEAVFGTPTSPALAVNAGLGTLDASGRLVTSQFGRDVAMETVVLTNLPMVPTAELDGNPKK